MHAIETHFPSDHHELHYAAPARNWDEAIPLGNSIMGALLWGNGRSLNVSLDPSPIMTLR